MCLYIFVDVLAPCQEVLTWPVLPRMQQAAGAFRHEDVVQRCDKIGNIDHIRNISKLIVTLFQIVSDCIIFIHIPSLFYMFLSVVWACSGMLGHAWTMKWISRVDFWSTLGQVLLFVHFINLYA